MKQTEQLFEVARRRFDTPEFRGIEFIEAECKTIINHVPGNMPFKWTINPYRGCTHACSYCLAGDTPVLMANGRTAPIAELREGDEIYGTVRRGNYRRYVKTKVLAHWSTVKPAYRVRLEDGTELVASGDHRLLSDRGWKHVTGAEQGRLQRPFLTLNNKLMGTGAFAAQPDQTDEYKRGYLCGLIRGDGLLRSYQYPRLGRTSNTVYRFRLALVDLDALRRARGYLAELSIVTRDEYLFQATTATRKPVYAITTQKSGEFEIIQEAVAWPDEPTTDWTTGFLAGIFDAEGGYSRGILRICNTHKEIIRQITRGLTQFEFPFVLEEPRASNGLTVVRLLGGLRQALRFFHTVDPAISRKRDIEGTAIKSNAPLRVLSIEPLGIDLPMYDITTGTRDFIANGVISHNCFARVTHTYLDMNAGKDFESKIVVKINAPEVLRAQLRAKRWHGEHIAMGTGTDPYQRVEGRYKLMRGIIPALIDYQNPFSILTKGTLILRDLDLLTDAARIADVSTAFSIGTLDDEVWRRSEPGTPHPKERMKAVAALNDAGVPCGVLVAPILPGISDDPKMLKDVVRAAIDAGATHVSPILLHLRPVVRDEYMGWLADNFPDLVPRYEQMYARSPYASPSDRNSLKRKVGTIVREAGGIKPRAHPSPRWHRDEAPPRVLEKQPEQLKLI